MAAFCLARNANTIGSPLFEIARVLVHLDHVALLEVACSIDGVPSTLDSRGRTIWIADAHRRRRKAPGIHGPDDERPSEIAAVRRRQTVICPDVLRFLRCSGIRN